MCIVYILEVLKWVLCKLDIHGRLYKLFFLQLLNSAFRQWMYSATVKVVRTYPCAPCKVHVYKMKTAAKLPSYSSTSLKLVDMYGEEAINTLVGSPHNWSPQMTFNFSQTLAEENCEEDFFSHLYYLKHWNS